MKRENKHILKISLAYIFQITLSLIFILPLIWMIISSLKLEVDLFRDMNSIKTFFVDKPSLENYKEMLSRSLVLKGTINSITYIGIILLIGIPINALCGYSLARLKFPGKNFILSSIIALYIVPFETVVLPLYLVSNTLKITNTFFALFLPFIGNCFNIFLFRQFFMSLPKELEEAASIDGCGVWSTFIKVVLPNTKPVIATATVLTIITHWSDFMWPLMAVTSPEHKTIQVAIQGFFTDPPIRYAPIMAALVFSTIPILIIYLLLQKYYVQGIMSSGIKG